MNEQIFGNISEADKKKADAILDDIMSSTTQVVLYLLKRFEEMGFSGAVAAPAQAAAGAGDAPKEEKASSFKLKIVNVRNKVKAIPILKSILGQNVQISVLAGLLKEGKVIEEKTFSAQEADELIKKFATEGETDVEKEEVK